MDSSVQVGQHARGVWSGGGMWRPSVNQVFLSQTGSFEYTRKVLLDLEQRWFISASILLMFDIPTLPPPHTQTPFFRCLSEIQKLGGNQPLEELILKLSHVYREEPCLVTGSSLTSQPPHWSSLTSQPRTEVVFTSLQKWQYFYQIYCALFKNADCCVTKSRVEQMVSVEWL